MGNDGALHLLETRGGVTQGLTEFFLGAHKPEIHEETPSSQFEIPACGVAGSVINKEKASVLRAVDVFH